MTHSMKPLPDAARGLLPCVQRDGGNRVGGSSSAAGLGHSSYAAASQPADDRSFVWEWNREWNGNGGISTADHRIGVYKAARRARKNLCFIVIRINASYSWGNCICTAVTTSLRYTFGTFFKPGSTIANQIAVMSQPDEAARVP
jgi:hypothetical protein